MNGRRNIFTPTMTDRATSVAVGCSYALHCVPVHVMWPNNTVM